MSINVTSSCNDCRMMNYFSILTYYYDTLCKNKINIVVDKNYYSMVYYYYTIVFYGERSRVNNADKNPYF